MTSVGVKDLHKSFGAVKALNGVTLEVAAGELFFLLGPSGCGKTTLLRCLAGFYQPDRGRIYFGEEDVTASPVHKRGTAMVFQNYALWPHLSIFDNIAFGLVQRKCNRAEIRQRVEEALAMVRLEGVAARKPGSLSGGQQQRVALARALVVRPHCLLLDEPLSNLDALLRQEMRREIRRLCKEFGLTTVYVTHDREEALSTADRLAVFADGHLLQAGTPAEVYRRPASRKVADFIGETNLIPGKVVHADYGEALVATALGEVRGVLAVAEESVAAGSEVTVSVRPEALKLDAYPADENCFSGDVTDVVYFGSSAHYRFVRDGVSLRVAELNPRHAGSQGREGQYVWFAPEDAVVLTR